MQVRNTFLIAPILIVPFMLLVVLLLTTMLAKGRTKSTAGLLLGFLLGGAGILAILLCFSWVFVRGHAAPVVMARRYGEPIRSSTVEVHRNAAWEVPPTAPPVQAPHPIEPPSPMPHPEPWRSLPNSPITPPGPPSQVAPELAIDGGLAWSGETDRLYLADVYASSGDAARALARQVVRAVPMVASAEIQYGHSEPGLPMGVVSAFADELERLRKAGPQEPMDTPAPAEESTGAWEEHAVQQHWHDQQATSSEVPPGQWDSGETHIDVTGDQQGDGQPKEDSETGTHEESDASAPPDDETLAEADDELDRTEDEHSADTQSDSGDAESDEAADVTLHSTEAEPSTADPNAQQSAEPADQDQAPAPADETGEPTTGEQLDKGIESTGNGEATQVDRPTLTFELNMPMAGQRTAPWDPEGGANESYGVLEVTVEGVALSRQFTASFVEKPWVTREAEFVTSRPRQQLVVVRSPGLATSRVDAEWEAQKLAGRVVAAADPRGRSVSGEALESIARRPEVRIDHFVQQLDGPEGVPLWRVAYLLNVSPERVSPLMASAWQTASVQEHHRKAERVRTVWQSLAVLVAVGVIYAVANSVTKGYFQGWLRTVCLLAIVAALFMIAILA